MDLKQKKDISGKASENKSVLQHRLTVVQNGANAASYALLRKILCYPVVLDWLWELGFGEYAYHFLTEMVRVAYGAYTVCSNHMVYAQHFLSFWESKIFRRARLRVST